MKSSKLEIYKTGEEKWRGRQRRAGRAGVAGAGAATLEINALRLMRREGNSAAAFGQHRRARPTGRNRKARFSGGTTDPTVRK